VGSTSWVGDGLGGLGYRLARPSRARRF